MTLPKAVPESLTVLRGLVIVFVLLWSGQAAGQQASLVRVETVRFQPLTQTTSVLGRLVSLQAGNIAARIAGPVEKIFVNVGDRVATGQIIAVLDAETLKADRNLAASELAEARADLGTSKAELALAQNELQRHSRLKKSPAFSQARYEDAEKKVAVARAKVTGAEARVAIREAALKRKILDVEYAGVQAPYDGVVVQRFTEAGAFVNRGDALVRVIGDRSLEIEADVPFTRLAGLAPGRTIDVRLDDGSSHTGVVRAILPSENPLTRTRAVRLKANFEKYKGVLAESQSVTVLVPLGAERRVLTVHKDAILKRRGGDLVYVVTSLTAQPMPVKLGEAIGERMEVLSGLQAGETVVVRGNERLRPGAKVRIEKGSS